MTCVFCRTNFKKINMSVEFFPSQFVQFVEQARQSSKSANLTQLARNEIRSWDAFSGHYGRMAQFLTALTMSSTYLRHSFTCGVYFFLFSARQQLLQNQTIIGFFPHFKWYQFRKFSHSTHWFMLVSCCYKGINRFCHSVSLFPLVFLVLKQTPTLSAIGLQELQRVKSPLLGNQLAHTMNHYTLIYFADRHNQNPF